ncbi:protein of unknown function [Nitrospira japonica]|uniref:Uncharacterized protein n=1 Tax=Nitrospira japonica TaxID=1325564 RepID=A0A1W1I5Z6_9BACT|nr:protein of unknown function [Nitrospira japonica]
MRAWNPQGWLRIIAQALIAVRRTGRSQARISLPAHYTQADRRLLRGNDRDLPAQGGPE